METGHYADRHQLTAIGHGVLAFINVAILLAVLAVMLSSRSGAPQAITAVFDLLAWLVGQVVRPVAGGTNVTLSTTLAPAGGIPTSPAGGADSGAGQGANSGGFGGILPVRPSTRTCFVQRGGQRVQVLANPDGSCPAA